MGKKTGYWLDIHKLLCKLEQKKKLVVLIAPNWPRSTWWTDIFGLLGDVVNIYSRRRPLISS